MLRGVISTKVSLLL